MEMKILTKLSVYDENRNCEDETYGERLVAEQDSKLNELGYDQFNVTLIRFSNGNEYEMSIYDAIQCLALKDGADLVRFPNGNVGFVGYYGSCPTSKNYFEILTDEGG